MTELHIVLGFAIVAFNAAAAVWGAWCWWNLRPSPAFWVLVRAGQAAVLIEVVQGGVMLLAGDEAPGDLHLVYGLLPVLVAFLAEQLRVASATQVLRAREIESAEAVGELPEREQRSVVLAILRREIGVMALAAAAITGLALRAGIVS